MIQPAATVCNHNHNRELQVSTSTSSLLLLASSFQFQLPASLVLLLYYYYYYQLLEVLLLFSFIFFHVRVQQNTARSQEAAQIMTLLARCYLPTRQIHSQVLETVDKQQYSSTIAAERERSVYKISNIFLYLGTIYACVEQFRRRD